MIPNKSFSEKMKLIADVLEPQTAHIKLVGLRGSSPAFIVTRLMEKLSAPFFTVMPDTETAEEFYREARFYSKRPQSIYYFPSWETSPYEQSSPHPDISGERLNTLAALLEGKATLVVMPVSALMQRVLPRSVLADHSQYLVVGEEIDRDSFLRKLVDLGYSMVPLVEDRGSASVRGGIVDMYLPSLANPVRIEFFGDFVESIRTFDPVTQRSLHPLEELVVLPSREIILSESVVQSFAIRLKARCDTLGIPATRRRELLEQLQQSIYPPGVEYLQPLLHPGLETLFDYAAAGVVVIEVDTLAVQEAANLLAEDFIAAEKRAEEKNAIICEGKDLCLSPDELTYLVSEKRLVSVPFLEIEERDDATPCVRFSVVENEDLKLTMSSDSEGVLRPLVERLSLWREENCQIFIVCHQRSQIKRLDELLHPYNLPLTIVEGSFPGRKSAEGSGVQLIMGEIYRGFRLLDDGLIVIGEEEIFGKRVKRRGISEIRKKQILVSLEELKPGDFMVHLDFGLGIYRGLQHLEFDCIGEDFLLLEYAGGDKLYLPVDRINLVQRYVGAENIQPSLDKLGGAGWEKKKSKAREAIEEMAGELLKIYAARQVHDGFAFSPPDELCREFEASFAFEETPDQMSAIEDVLSDMQSTKPMDRLVCGDVGYGKTEVAMRGAFKAVMDSKQVVVLVPTTVLAQQHLETFRKRFEAYPVTIDMLSRFRTPREQKATLERLKKGELDIIIGTHRLLQKDVCFKDLGLIIIDEEHRFGVSHKEKLKQYRTVVDALTLTATPIPRTLNMSLAGIRDLSIIDTPPGDRLAIKTFVARYSDELIREAVLRELRRGGQVFFVHNRVQSIGAMAEHLRNLIPEAKLAVGHGQMQEKELEEVMLGFMHGTFNLFICTAIIESGLDIPSANTMIVNRADMFGLAQLYQLRGRVGRSNQRAYAYFLIPPEGSISSDARERLRIIQELTELGAGFRIATHDLEIRGAGDFLGSRQSGNIAAVGFELYSELLEEAVCALKGDVVAERVEPEINLKIPAFVPEDYVPYPNQRLIIYKTLVQAEQEEDVDSVGDELLDRFGKLPLTVNYLLETMKLRIHLRKLLVKRLEFNGTQLVFAFHEKTPVSPDTIIGLIRNSPKIYRFSPDFVFTASVVDTSFEGVLAAARNLLKRLV
ncbi:MAG: transcription-repair coupling factor [Geobacteraceae bacterium]|nr:transcription-repair coupling factor [Geobacteraceae bacterium]